MLPHWEQNPAYRSTAFFNPTHHLFQRYDTMNKIKDIWKFLSYDIWRITEEEVTGRVYSVYNIIKTIYLCIARFSNDRLASKASALTYSTLLAIVPMLAIIFAVARGFGFDAVVEAQVRSAFGANAEATEAILKFVDTYLSQTKNGVFIGVGLVMLLWTVINLVNNIEVTFNHIWGVSKERSMFRKITDYFSMFLLLPIFIVVSGGLSIYMGAFVKEMESFVLLAPILQFFISLIPFALTWIMFTGLYIFMPNTSVKFKHALVSGIIAGTAYQFFQYLYISSQMGVSKYNAIYGSFAALPLFLLWLQVSWTICLFGAELTFAGQNIRNFSFDRDTRNISRRYRDFVSILILSRIAHQFATHEGQPYDALRLSEELKLPIRLTQQTLDLLRHIGLIHEVWSDQKSEAICYRPSIDVNQLNVGVLLDKLDTTGSEDFKIDIDGRFSDEWRVLTESREEYYKRASTVLLKDL